MHSMNRVIFFDALVILLHCLTWLGGVDPRGARKEGIRQRHDPVIIWSLFNSIILLLFHHGRYIIAWSLQGSRPWSPKPCQRPRIWPGQVWTTRRRDISVQSKTKWFEVLQVAYQNCDALSTDHTKSLGNIGAKNSYLIVVFWFAGNPEVTGDSPLWDGQVGRPVYDSASTYCLEQPLMLVQPRINNMVFKGKPIGECHGFLKTHEQQIQARSSTKSLKI